jgi:RHS repeat-associated protein
MVIETPALVPSRDESFPSNHGARRVGTGAATGYIRSVRVFGEGFSIGGGWWWERLPDRIATAGLGEWELVRRQVSAYDPAVSGSSATSAPHYEQRHGHLHRNGRFDVVGRSPLDAERQLALARQFSPYGRPLAEAWVDENGTAAGSVAPSYLPEDISTDPEDKYARRRIWERGLTGKPYDPELEVCWFGYRWYSPELRRWMQEEPLGLDGPNLYHFVFNHPIQRWDPNGLTPATDLADGACGYFDENALDCAGIGDEWPWYLGGTAAAFAGYYVNDFFSGTARQIGYLGYGASEAWSGYDSSGNRSPWWKRILAGSGDSCTVLGAASGGLQFLRKFGGRIASTSTAANSGRKIRDILEEFVPGDMLPPPGSCTSPVRSCSSGSSGLRAIGKRGEYEKWRNLNGVSVYDSPVWDRSLNRAWVREGAENGDTFLLVSEVSSDALLNGPEPSMLLEELLVLDEYLYTLQDGGWLLPPP